MKVEWFFVNQDIQIQTEGEFDIEDLYNGLEDLVVINEINPSSGCDWLAYDGKVYELSYTDISMIKEKGVGRAYYIGEVIERIDLNVKSDVDFGKWYFGEEDFLSKLK